MEWDMDANGQRGLIVGGIWFCEELVVPAIRNLEEDITILRAILAPLIAHADRHDYAPPIRLSVRQCREIKEKVNG